MGSVANVIGSDNELFNWRPVSVNRWLVSDTLLDNPEILSRSYTKKNYILAVV